MTKIKLIILLVFFYGSLSSQIIIKGFIKNNDNEPIPFTNVLAKKDSITILAYTYADEKGAYELSIENSNKINLVFSALGYEKKDFLITIKPFRKEIKKNVILKQSFTELDEVIIQTERNIKVKNYAFYRLDTFFSKTRYSNIRFINNGGWHFTNLKSPKDIKYKLKSYLHHREFDINPLSIEEIENLIKNKKAIYDLTTDKRNQKIADGTKLEKYDLNKLPSYINNNLEKFKDWID